MRHLAILAALALAACSKGDSTADSTQVALAGAADAPRVVVVNAHDFSYTIPDTIPAGMTTFRLINEGQALHHLVIARLDSGKTMADVSAALKNPGPLPGWMVLIGGPNAPDPKGESNATVDIAAGNYALICFVDLPGGVPHFAKGMVKGLTVVPSAVASAPAPVATDTITLNDYSFALSRPLGSGTRTFRVVNNASQLHEVELVKMAPGKTMDDLMAWFKSPNGPPPGSAIGGTAPSATGLPVWFTAEITPGDYLLICFLPAPDGKLHLHHGMVLAQKVE